MKKPSSAMIRMGLLFLTALSTAQANAQQMHQVTRAPASNSQYVAEHVIDVDDRPGHQVRIYELRYDYPARELAFAGVAVTHSLTRGMSDYVNWSGPFTTYSTYFLEDGSRIFSRAIGTTQAIDSVGSNRSFRFTFVEHYVGGTGKFKGIRGQLRGGGERLAGAKTLTQRSEGEYWIDD